MRELFPTENPSQLQQHSSNKKASDNNVEHSLEAKKIWDYICEELRSHLGEDLCKRWILPIRAQASNEDELILIVPTIGFYQVILSDYLELIERCKNKLGFEHVSTVIDLDREHSSTMNTPKDRGLFRDSSEDEASLPKSRKSKTQKIDQSSKPSQKTLLDDLELVEKSSSDNELGSSNIENSPYMESLGSNEFDANETVSSLDLGKLSEHEERENDGNEQRDNIVGWGKIESIEKEGITAQRPSSDTLFSHTLSRKTKLNPNYTFETFVRGPSNQFALAACYNVAENPGKSYNPLFIYGATGLGKTHLLHAVGNHIIKMNPHATVAYISSERFMNELIYCLRHNKIIDFRQKYRHCDLFLMDDIQFISGNKAATQEEFFHTFNTLYEVKKQIIITSDLFPQDIPDIEERLRNRFQWGLIADIQPPDIEHRIAILYSKAEQLGIRLSIDVAEYIANFVKRNVRELEGALHRLDAFASLHGKTLDKSLAIETFSNVLSEESSKPQMLIDAVQKIVAEHFQIKTSELKSKRRHKALTLPRQVAMYLSRKFTKTSYPEIGEKFGGKDHTTVIHAVRKITLERKKNMDLMVHLDALERILERLN